MNLYDNPLDQCDNFIAGGGGGSKGSDTLGSLVVKCSVTYWCITNS